MLHLSTFDVTFTTWSFYLELLQFWFSKGLLHFLKKLDYQQDSDSAATNHRTVVRNTIFPGAFSPALRGRKAVRFHAIYRNSFLS